jgi:hypothetical protein
LFKKFINFYSHFFVTNKKIALKYITDFGIHVMNNLLWNQDEN